MMKTILIITNSNDIHADLITPIIKSKKQPLFRINLDRFPCDYKLTQRFFDGNHHIKVEHLPSGESIDLMQVGAIWNRKPAEFTFLSDDLTAQEKVYAKKETEHALFGLLYPLNCHWVSHPVALRGSMWKGEQLNRAKQIGFKVPASLVSNCPDEVLNFKNNLSGDMVFKSLSTPDLGSREVDAEDRITYGLSTTLVTDELMENLEAVREIPCHFQEYVPKKYELRVTVIGGKVFAAKIHSQQDERTRIDSRDMSAEILYEATTLPEEIERRCLDLVKSYNLSYSAMDIIVTPEDEYVFLENNPNGEFLYVEQLIPEFKMLETLADSLVSEAQCRNH